MNFCSKCGTQIEDAKQQFCSNCGEKIERQESSSPTVSATGGMPDQTNGQVTFEQSYNAYPATPIIQHPMKWFKFLIYFALFFGALINFVFGFNYITGGIYFSQTNGQATAEMVYATFGMGLKVLDIIYGILMIAIAVFSIYTRFRLAKFKSNGPLCVYILYGSGACLTLLYNIVLIVVTGLNQLTSATSITSLIISAGFILINYSYFKKRKELFVK